MSIHENIKAARLQLGMSEQQFAERVGVTRGAVQQWERKNGTAPNRSRQSAVAELMGISVAELMSGGREALPPTESKFSYLANDLAKMLDSITDEQEKRLMYAHCVLILTKDPVFLNKLGYPSKPAT